MSRLSDVVVTAGGMDIGLMEPFTRWDDDRKWSGRLGFMGGPEADPFWSTGKGSPTDIWVGTFDHLDREALLADLERLAWSEPWKVQVFVRDEYSDCFGVWMLFDGELREVPLPRTQRSGEVLARTDR